MTVTAVCPTDPALPDRGRAGLRPDIEGQGREFGPDEFLRSMAGYVGLGAGCEYAVSKHRYPMG